MEAYIQWPGFEPASEENQWEHKQHFMFRTICMLIGPAHNIFLFMLLKSIQFSDIQFF